MHDSTARPTELCARFFSIALLIVISSRAAFGFSPKEAPLMTQWAKDVNPANPWPQYPRPQLVRRDWLSLNGVWEYQPGAPNDKVPTGSTLSSEILVPFPVESALSGVMEHHDRLWYRRSFAIPSDWRGKRILLHFDAVDYESEVYINGKSVGIHKGGYDAFSYDITPLLRPEADQELIVRVFDPTEAGGQPRGKQTTHPSHIMYTPTTGIWQSVWLEPVAATSVESLRIVPDIDQSAVHITVQTAPATADAEVTIVVKDGNTAVATAKGRANAPLDIQLPDAKLWSPDTPFLYDLDISLNVGGQTTDQVSSYFGMRKISLGQDHGVTKILLNNKFVFEFGPLDQGFWPDGIYTPPTEEALKHDISSMKSMGFNMVRKHIKVEPDRWYYWTDKMGLLVWQDMPSMGTYLHLAKGQRRPPDDDNEFKSELQRMVVNHWDHPSIIMWVIFNEGQGEHDTGDLVKMVKSLDPSRLVNEASGGRWDGFGDVRDLHHYPEPQAPAPHDGQAIACGEYGGIGLRVPGHTWTRRGNGYTDASDPEELVYEYGYFANIVKNLAADNGLSAVVYTQLTDVENELNGLLTYDRIPKADPADFARATHFQFTLPSYKPIVPTAQDGSEQWRYTTSQPADNWASQAFDDSAWTAGHGVIGNAPSVADPITWTKSDIWLRRHFDPGQLSPEDINHLVERDWHSGELQVYINGEVAYRQRDANAAYGYHLLTRGGKQAIRPNADNVLAIHCVGTTSKVHFIDAEIYQRIPADSADEKR